MEPRSLERGAINAPEQAEDEFDAARAAEVVDSVREDVAESSAESERGGTVLRVFEASTAVAAGGGDAEAGRAAWEARMAA